MERRKLLMAGGVTMLAALQEASMITPSGAIDHLRLESDIRALGRRRAAGDPSATEHLERLAATLAGMYRAHPRTRVAYTAAVGCVTVAGAVLRGGDVAAGARWAQQGADLADAAGDRHIESLCWITLTDARLGHGDVSGAMSAIVRASGRKHDWVPVRAWSRVASIRARTGDHDRASRALDSMDDSIAVAIPRTPRPDWAMGLGAGWSINRRALTFRDLGLWERAYQCFTATLEGQEGAVHRAQIQVGMAEAQAGMGNPDAAASIALEALPVLAAAGDRREVQRIARLHDAMAERWPDVASVVELAELRSVLAA